MNFCRAICNSNCQTQVLPANLKSTDFGTHFSMFDICHFECVWQKTKLNRIFDGFSTQYYWSELFIFFFALLFSTNFDIFLRLFYLCRTIWIIQINHSFQTGKNQFRSSFQLEIGLSINVKPIWRNIYSILTISVPRAKLKSRLWFMNFRMMSNFLNQNQIIMNDFHGFWPSIVHCRLLQYCSNALFALLLTLLIGMIRKHAEYIP